MNKMLIAFILMTT